MAASSGERGEDGRTADGTCSAVVDPLSDTFGVVDVMTVFELVEVIAIGVKLIETNGAVLSFQLGAVGDGYDLQF